MVGQQERSANRSHEAKRYKLHFSCQSAGRKYVNIDKFDTRILSWSLPWSLSQSLSHQIFYQIKVKASLSVQCVAAEIEYSSQILQSCSKLRWSFCHSVSFQCLFKMRNLTDWILIVFSFLFFPCIKLNELIIGGDTSCYNWTFPGSQHLLFSLQFPKVPTTSSTRLAARQEW